MSGVISPYPSGSYTWAPGDNNLLYASDDPWASQSTGLLIAGTGYLVKVKAPASGVVSNVWLMSNGAAGAGASTGSFAAVISSAGARLGLSADAGALFTAGFVPIEVPLLAGPVPVTGPFVYVAVLSNLATTQPTLATGQGNGNFTNLNLAAGGYRYCTFGTGLVAIPASINLAATVLAGNLSIWAGLS